MKRLSCYLAVLMLAACTRSEPVAVPEIKPISQQITSAPETLQFEDDKGCLDITDQDLDYAHYEDLSIWNRKCQVAVNKKYAELLKRADQQDPKLHGLTRTYFEEVHQKQAAYRELLCSDPTSETDLRSPADWYIYRCLIRTGQAYLRTLNEF